ncbi:MAG: amidohydrolase family protein [Rhodomicrobiaceae bacterium]
MRIDAHQHFWSIARGDYDWLTPELGAIYRDFSPDDLKPLLEEARIEGTILVQAAPTEAETRYMLGLACENPFIKGVVGWVDFEAADAPDRIAELAQEPALVGLRPMIQDIPDPDWMLRDALTPAYEALIAADLTFDALTLPRHLKQLRLLLTRHPRMRVVIDHASKPDIRTGGFDGWAGDMAVLASSTNAFCKLSGLVTEAARDWTIEDLRPYVAHLLAMFGASRLIWGSDWPVCTLAASYGEWIAATDELLAAVSEADKAAIMGGNAIRAYQLKR